MSPALDGTGPQGLGPMTGRGLGWCSGNFPRGRGFGRGRGFAPSCQGMRPICPACPFLAEQNQKQQTPKEQKQFLQEELKALEEEKAIIEVELKKLK